MSLRSFIHYYRLNSETICSFSWVLLDMCWYQHYWEPSIPNAFIIICKSWFESLYCVIHRKLDMSKSEKNTLTLTPRFCSISDIIVNYGHSLVLFSDVRSQFVPLIQAIFGYCAVFYMKLNKFKYVSFHFQTYGSHYFAFFLN